MLIVDTCLTVAGYLNKTAEERKCDTASIDSFGVFYVDIAIIT
jgi:hypothetical protein